MLGKFCACYRDSHPQLPFATGLDDWKFGSLLISFIFIENIQTNDFSHFQQCMGCLRISGNTTNLTDSVLVLINS